MALQKNTAAAEPVSAAQKAAATKAAKKAAQPAAAAEAPKANGKAKAPAKEAKPAKAEKPAKAAKEPKPEAPAEEGKTVVVGKKQLAEAISAYVKTKGMGLPTKVAELAVEGFEQSVLGALSEGQEVRTVLGKFFAQNVDARTGRNPATGEELQVAAHVAPKFKPSAVFKRALNGGGDEEATETEGGDAE